MRAMTQQTCFLLSPLIAARTSTTVPITIGPALGPTTLTVRGGTLNLRRGSGRRKFSAAISAARLGIKSPLPTVPAEEITAWYQHPTRHVSYNNDQYEIESTYERKYLSGSDQYAVFLNSNQAQTVIEGSGKSGKFLLIKDSYGNTFSQFPVENYAEVHVLDLRFFKGDVAEYAKENGITDTLVLYGTQNFVKDRNLRF